MRRQACIPWTCWWASPGRSSSGWRCMPKEKTPANTARASSMQRFQNARALVLCQHLCRVGVECRRHGIRISGLKEHQVLRWKYGFILGDCIIDTVFPGILFKALQVCFGNVDIGDALILTDQLLNGLLAGRLLIFHCCFLRFSLDISDPLQAKSDNR